MVGFAGCGKARDDESGSTGEVFAIYVLGDYIGRGVGYRLMQAALDQLKAYDRIGVWVLKDNERAIRFYKRCGFRSDGQEKAIMLYMFFTSGDLLDAPEWTDRKEKGQIEHTQHDPGHFDIALALAEYVTDLQR